MDISLSEGILPGDQGSVSWGKDEKKQVRQPELPYVAAASQDVQATHRKQLGGYTNLSSLLCIFEAEDWALVQTHNLCKGVSQQIREG